jgi:hypothetical protein
MVTHKTNMGIYAEPRKNGYIGSDSYGTAAENFDSNRSFSAVAAVRSQNKRFPRFMCRSHVLYTYDVA